MASIKDVAKKAGISVTTVSIILNGKAEERKISLETQEKVKQAMRDLNYQPNPSAKKLRTQNKRKTVALFWTTDFRDVMLVRFLKGLQDQIHNQNLPFDVVIYPYINNRLSEEPALKNTGNFHGAIIANAGTKDMDYLNSVIPLIPVILYNRISDHYGSAYVDDSVIATKAYHLIKDLGHVAIVSAPHAFEGMKVRDHTLMDLLNENGQKYMEYPIDNNTSRQGYEAAKTIDFSDTDVIYAASDMIALGIMHYCFQHDISIPENLKILAIGNGLTNVDEFLNPALTTIQIPIETMAAECIRQLDEQFNHPGTPIRHREIEAEIILRETL